MLITRIELENIKSYRQVTVDFRRGTTAISGANGTGKTTLVEAIGFALFGYLPYKHDQFVREGEKYGKVVVYLLGNDERPYTVERRCGSGGRWFIYDQEADLRLEQRADVEDKLHEIFGIDRERPLDSLFRDALGVPQGTFTAIFLDVGSKRKQTFDALLQIEDYKTAADNLLETQKYYKEQMLEQKAQIQRLTVLTSELDTWRLQLKEARQLDEQQKEQNAIWSKQQAEYEQHLRKLNEQLNRLLALEQRFNTCQASFEHANTILHERETQVLAAREAQKHVQASLHDYQRYQQTQEILTHLRQNAQQRDALRQRRARDENAKTKLESTLQNVQERLNEVKAAHQQISILAPLVEQQIEYEKQRDEAKQRVTRYEHITAEMRRLQTQQAKYQQEQIKLQDRIATIEPLVPVAELLQERSEALTQLRIQTSERNNTLRQLQEKREALRERQLECDQLAGKFQKAERNVALIEEHRQEAEEMPGLQGQYDQLADQKIRLEGNIEGYVKSRTQSAGGQCPLLNESCLNIRKHGIASLESYFDGLLSEEHAQINGVIKQQETLQRRMNQIKKFADALNKLDRYIEQRDMLAEQLQRVKREIERLERDSTLLSEAVDMLKHIEQSTGEVEKAYKESTEADSKVRELTGLYKQIQQLQGQVHQYELEYQERQQEANSLQGSREELQQFISELSRLNDPRSRIKVPQDIVAREEGYRKQLATEQQKLQDIVSRLNDLDTQLVTYNSLDEEIAQQEEIQRQSAQGYQIYLTFKQEAQQLPTREQAQQQQANTTEIARQQLQEVESAYQAARTVFDQQELTHVQEMLERLRNDLVTLAQKMKHHQEYMNTLEQKISEGEAYMVELEAAQHEYQTLEDLHTMTEQFRKLIKEAAPQVLRAMLADISLEANRIFGEIMGDRSAQLSWRNEYEVILRRQGVDRSFAQLSGGEQMSAALAVRLALLKKLSTLNIAFFDEPTQNMDDLRRMNLAEQIRRVRGFDQLIVISHDDTFEQGLDSLVRLDKAHGETQLVVNEDDSRDGSLPPSAPSDAFIAGYGRQGQAQPLQYGDVYRSFM
jgi:exonuclease SbcC